jgi:hypothetical protein
VTRYTELGEVVRRPPPFPAGRRCSKPGCGAILSRWNGGLRCWHHETSLLRHEDAVAERAIDDRRLGAV